MANQQVVAGSLCYLFHEDRVLLLKRRNPPYAGYWSPPGGKQEFGESPRECCIREIREETGITIAVPQLRVIQTVIDIAVPIHWQLFIYRQKLVSLNVPPGQPAHHEGELRWFNLAELANLNRPYTDVKHWHAIIAADEGILQTKFVYNTPDVLVSEHIYGK